MSHKRGNQKHNNATVFVNFINDILNDVATAYQTGTQQKGRTCGTNKRKAANMYRRSKVGELMANIVETDKGYEIHAVLPGFTRSEINITMDGNLLTIKAMKAEDNKNKATNYSRKEYTIVNKERSFKISDKVDADGIRAKSENGILTVTLPKKVNKSNAKNINIS